MSTNSMQNIGLKFDETTQTLDLDFTPTIDSIPLYDFMTALYTLSDVTQSNINNENFYGNEIQSSLFETTEVGSEFLRLLHSRLRGSNQISSIKLAIRNTANNFSDFLELLDIRLMTNYSTGKFDYAIDLLDKTTQKKLTLEI